MRDAFRTLVISALGALVLSACATRIEESAATVEPGTFTAFRYSEATALHYVRVIAERGLRDGIVAPPMGNCLAKTDTRSFVEVFSQLLSREFNRSELEQLDEFFRTRAGEQYAARAIHQGFGMFGPAPTLSIDEQPRLDELVRTEVGKKLMDWQFAHSGAAFGDLIAKLNEVRANCIPRG